MAQPHDKETRRASTGDDRVDRLEQRLRAEAPAAMTPAPPELRSRVLGEIWETTPDGPSVLARIGRPALAAAAVLAVTAGAMMALSTLSGRLSSGAAGDGDQAAIVSLLDQARSWGDRLPRLPENVGMGAETERVLADARRAAQQFGERLMPVRTAFLGATPDAAETTPEVDPPAPLVPEQPPG